MENIFEERIEKWREKRCGKITSSELNHFMQKGKTTEVKNEIGEKIKITNDWNAKTISYLYKVKYQRRTKSQREETQARNFEWGHSCEPLAIMQLRENTMNQIVSCSNDFDEIVFNEPFEGFGDSPDFYELDANDNIIAVGEIKTWIS